MMPWPLGFIVLISASYVSAAERVSTITGGKCSIEQNTASCCATIVTEWEVCVVFEVRFEELKAYVELTVNGRMVLSQELQAREFCTPVMIGNACLEIYRISGSLKDKTLEVCSRVYLQILILRPSVDLKCFPFQEGRSSFNRRKWYNGQEGIFKK